MLDFSHLLFKKLAVHKVGSKSQEIPCFQSSELHSLEDDFLQNVLFEFFFDAFNGEEQYKFSHVSGVDMNDMFVYCKNIFEQPDTFHEISTHILQHLYNVSTHPRIKPGELYVGYFTDCLIDDELVDAIGIFKSEQTQNFLQVNEQVNSLEIFHYEGISTKKLDKGCLIFNTLQEDGFMVKIIDALNGDNDEAKYWRSDFLGVDQVKDSVYTTKAYINLCKDFASEVLAESSDKGKSGSFEMVTKAVEYFENSEEFNLENFTESVIEEPAVKNEFTKYKAQYETKNEVELVEDFDIAPATVKKEKRKFKQLITLDNSIQLKLNSAHSERNSEVIERGFDPEKGMYFYKVYFEQEG